MTSYLNAYCNLVDISTKDGQTLLSNATNKFESPLDGHNKISLWPRGKDYQKLNDNLTRLLQRFGYQYLLQSVVTVRTLTPAILPVNANAAAGIIAAPGIPILIMYTNGINIMEIYSDKLLEISQKHASLTWGFGSFTNQTPQVICELTQTGRELTATGQLTTVRKEVIQKRLHSKILAFQILAKLCDDACKVIECQSEEYMWKDMNGLDEEMDGMTITALTHWHLPPHHKVNMYFEIGAVKKMIFAHYDNDINLFFDWIKSVKLQIDSKDPMAFTDNAFVCADIFVQLKRIASTQL